MGTSIIMFPFFLLCFLCLPFFTTSAENCLNNQCSKAEPFISYPFRIKGRQGERCGFPGFDLTCDNKNRTVLELPFTGPFFVSYISYGSTYNGIQLQDPDICLPRRFLNQLNLSGTPFIVDEYQNYSFFNCSSNVSTSIYAPILFYSTSISCLSSSKHAVYVTSPESRDSSWLKRNCSLIATIPVPVPRYYSRWIPNDVVLHLTWRWNEPYCKWNCNKYPNVPYTGSRNTKKLLITTGIIFLVLFGFLAYRAHISCRVANSPSQDVSSGAAVQTTPPSAITTTGLGSSAIQSFPMVVLGESGRLLDPDINTCSICLSEYQPKETLKTLPGCNHCFHADCIDVWLHLKSTCPVCRKSPLIR
ncbi:hypothetical protein MKX01_031403 [Papaver californicum]|nr:hypothetical protein MKX01_031403 [Papaver californicum]